MFLIIFLFQILEMVKGKKSSLVLGLVVDKGDTTAATVVTVEVVGHENTGAALSILALAAEAGDLAAVVHLVELEHRELHLLLLVLVLFGCRVVLLLSLLGTTEKSGGQLQSELLLDGVRLERVLVLESNTSVEQALLANGHASLGGQQRLHAEDRLAWIDIQSDGGTRKGFDENLHV